MSAVMDVSQLRTECLYGRGSSQVDLAQTVMALREPSLYWGSAGLTDVTTSLGFAMADPSFAGDYTEACDDPHRLTWFVSGWGHDRKLYDTNAVRELQLAARTGRDTLDIWLDNPELFDGEAKAQQQEDGSFIWGDAVFVEFCGRRLLGAVSGLTQEDNAALAAAILGLIGAQMFKADHSA